jgi:hypothetical protein
MYCIISNKRIHIQCFIPLLQPNKRIGIFIPFHLHLLSGIVIHFPNGIDIPRTKRGLLFLKITCILIEHVISIYIYVFFNLIN